MENNFEDDNAIVYAWINLSVGKKQNSTRGSEEGCESYADGFVRETPNLLNTSVNSKIAMKSLSLSFPFYFSPNILQQPPVKAGRLNPQQGRGCMAVLVSLLPMMVLPLGKCLLEDPAEVLGWALLQDLLPDTDKLQGTRDLAPKPDCRRLAATSSSTAGAG